MEIPSIFNASIGIIGGADGPTAVLVTGNPAALIAACVVLIALAALIVFIHREFKRK